LLNGGITVFKALVVAGGLLALSTPSQADILFYNINEATTGWQNVSLLGTIATAGRGPIWESFSTGANAVRISDIELMLRAENPNDGGLWSVTINGAANVPSSLLTGPVGGFRNDALLSTTFGAIDVPLTPITLAAHTRYWVEVSSIGRVDWGFAGSGQGPGVAGEFIYNPFGSSSPFSTATGAFQMLVQGPPVIPVNTPEPNTLPLMLAGLLVLVGVGGQVARRRV
jgi:hypothetical protein